METFSPEIGFSSLSAGALLEPDTVTPEQFFGSKLEGVTGGERRLMAAVLADGVEAYLVHWRAVASGFKSAESEAREWVDTQDHSYPFSFDVVCESLGINPQYLRLGLRRCVHLLFFSEGEGTAWRKMRRPRV